MNLVSYVNSAVNCFLMAQCKKSCHLLLSDLHALQEKESIVIDTSEQISTKSNDKSGNLHTIHYSYI